MSTYPQFFTKNNFAWAVVISAKDYIEISTLVTSRQLLFGPSEIYVQNIIGTYQTCSKEIFMKNLGTRFEDFVNLLLPFFPKADFLEIQNDVKNLRYAH